MTKMETLPLMINQPERLITFWMEFVQAKCHQIQVKISGIRHIGWGKSGYSHFLIILMAVAGIIGFILLVNFLLGESLYVFVFTFLFILLILYALIRIVYFLINRYLEYKKKICTLKVTDFPDREKIYNTYKNLKDRYNKTKFIIFLEDNIKKPPLGEWPDKDIFKLTNTDTNIALAMLEEKWLKLDR